MIKTAMRLNLRILFIYTPTHFTRLAHFLQSCAAHARNDEFEVTGECNLLQRQHATARRYSKKKKNQIRNLSLLYSKLMHLSFLILFLNSSVLHN